MSTPDRPKLDRIPHFDERSRNYALPRAVSTAGARRKRVWKTRPVPLDQGREGACVGFGMAAELAATPVPYPGIDDAAALDLYRAAQAQDRAMGNHWDSGASVLAGCKALVASGRASSYRWAFGIDAVITALAAKGPVVLGIPWHEGMYETDERGQVHVTGELVGGHCILANGWIPNHPIFGEDMIEWTNSWGPAYGRGGKGWIRPADLEALLKDQGEAVLITDKRPR